jgi:flagellar biosynthetic protein FliP
LTDCVLECGACENRWESSEMSISQETTNQKKHRRPIRSISGLKVGLLLLVIVLLATGCASDNPVSVPTFDLGDQVGSSDDPQAVSSALQILLLLTVLSLAPALLVMVTAFTRIVIVLSFVRNALSVPQVPPNQVIIGLSLFLTLFVMAPTWNQVNEQALQPYLNGDIDQQTAYEQGIEPVREFLFQHARERDLALFINLADLPRPQTRDDVPTYVLIPAFIISELKTAFQMGVVIFVPFLIIDLVVASVLMSMGMMMLPPSLISMPFKLLLFVMVDGWHLIVRSLVISFGGG